MGLIAACEKPTGVVADVSATAAVSTFSLSVAGLNGLLATQTFDGTKLPGTVFVELSPSAGHVRLVARSSSGGLSASGGADVSQGLQPVVPLAMKSGELDTDGDGWPDAIDDCPTFADPKQDCAGGVPCGQRSDLLTCVDFEDGGADLSNFGEATATFPTGGAALGQRYLRVTRDTGLGTYSGQYVDINGAPAHLFVRMFIQLDTVHPKHFTLFSPQQTRKDDGIEINVDTDGGVISGFIINNRGLGTSTTVQSPLSLNAWHCIEGELVQGTTSAAQFSMWVDEQPLQGASSLGAFEFDRILVGATYDVGDGNPVLLDEIASANQRIHCR